MYTLPPFFRYSPAISARRCQRTTLCHSVRSCHWPSLSLYRSFVASVSLATGVPLGVYFTSGSLPRFPSRITLLTLFPDMGRSFNATQMKIVLRFVPLYQLCRRGNCGYPFRVRSSSDNGGRFLNLRSLYGGKRHLFGRAS